MGKSCKIVMIKCFFVFCFSLFLIVVPTRKLLAQKKDFVEVNSDSLVNFAKKFIGIPYLWAGATPKGFDCSGFVYYVYNHFGIKTSHNSNDFPKLGLSVSIDSCKIGDIILFTGEKAKDRKVGHVGIVISKFGEPVTFIQSSSSKKHNGVVITDYNKSRYKSRFIGVVRLTKSA